MIEYIEEGHIYLADGIIIPGVSELVAFATKKDLSGIPAEILRRASEYGTNLHAAVEDYLVNGVIDDCDDIRLKYGLEEFLRLKDEYIGNDPISEMIVDFDGHYAGRIDCLSNDVLIDFKTNYKPDIEWMEWQLGFYKTALESKGIIVNKCMCLWLPKGKVGKWITITPSSKEGCLEVLKEYESANQSY